MIIMTPENKTVDDVLSDGHLHPIMSDLRIKFRESTSFWISETSDKSVFQPEDHSESQCYLIPDFVPEKWARDGSDLSAIGRAAINNGRLIGLITIGEIGYVYDHEAYNEKLDASSRALSATTDDDDIPF